MEWCAGACASTWRRKARLKIVVCALVGYVQIISGNYILSQQNCSQPNHNKSLNSSPIFFIYRQALYNSVFQFCGHSINLYESIVREVFFNCSINDKYTFKGSSPKLHLLPFHPHTRIKRIVSIVPARFCRIKQPFVRPRIISILPDLENLIFGGIKTAR